ncbi:unnamed protein product [Cladocopium goreaui]|uniref:Phosphoribulokinase/uridine kinase domain-containing protein n=1 Tax=Cladocopium goreaui TaxID=2562237 RepID=A0A9P1DA65_9DINO|nr:unnamed protein product [Cladocopium goreaui]
MTIVALSGCTRSGKSLLAKMLEKHLDDVKVVHQDDFWYRSVAVEVNGRPRRSEEEPSCTNFDAMRQCVEEMAKCHRIVIVEGFQVLYDPKLRELFDHMIHLDLTFDECLHRRTAARSPLNPNPLSPQDVVDLAARRLIGMFTFKSFEFRNRIWHVTSFASPRITVQLPSFACARHTHPL